MSARPAPAPGKPGQRTFNLIDYDIGATELIHDLSSPECQVT